MFSVNCEKSGGVAVVKCAGRIVRGEAVYTLKSTVSAQGSARIIVLDLSDVESLDGGGLGTLVFLHRWARDNGIQLKLVNPSPLVYEMLERTRLNRVFDISTIHDVLNVLGTDQSEWKNSREWKCALGW